MPPKKLFPLPRARGRGVGDGGYDRLFKRIWYQRASGKIDIGCLNLTSALAPQATLSPQAEKGKAPGFQIPLCLRRGI
jgi:hypothetical protein